MAKTETIVDAFGTQNDAIWDYTGPTVSGGQLRIIPTAAYPTIMSGTADLTNSYTHIQLVQNANAGNGTINVEFGVQLNSNNYAEFTVNNGSIYFTEVVAGSRTEPTVAYNSTTHKWLRLRHSGTTLFWEVSADGISWTSARSKTPGFALTAVQIYVLAGFDGTEPAPGTAIFDNVSIVQLPATATGVMAGMLSCVGGVDGGTVGANPPGADVFPFVQTAAATYGWGTPTKSDDFLTNPTDGVHGWNVPGPIPGHDGNGTRDPAALSVVTTDNGILTITGNSSGRTGLLDWYPGPTYGRWEVAMKCRAGALNYHPVMLLWPNGSDDWAAEGEVDWVEIHDNADRQTAHYFLHYGVANKQAVNFTKDCTQWHSWALEWRADHITAYCDGQVWYNTTDLSNIPNTAHYLSLQLDNFGGSLTTAPYPAGADMQFAWAYEYA